MKRFRSFRWLAVVIAAFAMVLGIEVPAMASTGVDGFPIIHASTGGLAHRCDTIGTSDDGYYKAVVCVDIYTDDDGSGDYGVFAQLEDVCEANGVIVQCEKGETTGIWSTGSGGDLVFSGSCGDGLVTCPSGRFIAQSSLERWFPPSDSGCGTDADSVYQEWVVAYANETTITLPNDVPLTGPSSNFETGHYYVCW